MENGLAARNGGRIGLVGLVAILLLGLGLRLGEAWDGRPPVYDARAYAPPASRSSSPASTRRREASTNAWHA